MELEVSLEQIESQAAYVVFSRKMGLLSEHTSATESIRAYARYLSRNMESDAVIYKREQSRWSIF